MPRFYMPHPKPAMAKALPGVAFLDKYPPSVAFGNIAAGFVHVRRGGGVVY